jgi:hypothetical protein
MDNMNLQQAKEELNSTKYADKYKYMDNVVELIVRVLVLIIDEIIELKKAK